jgi:L-fuculose-phosphate aldolase
MSTGDDAPTRQAIIDTCRAMNAAGVNQGSSGNVSVRVGQGMLITPSGIAYDAMTPEMIVAMPLDAVSAPETGLAPSTEWRFHQRLLRDKPEMRAVVHAHPAHCTALAVNRDPIPACHYMIAAFGGDSVPVAGYALFGGAELAEKVARAMQGRCLMANHGAVVVGETLDKALWRMVELEHLARVYTVSRSLGTPHILTAAEIAEALEGFRGYGPTPAGQDR